jgi:hypothetical protein
MGRANTTGITGLARSEAAQGWQVKLHDGEKSRFLGNFPERMLDLATALIEEARAAPPSKWDGLKAKYRNLKKERQVEEVADHNRDAGRKAAEPDGFEEYVEDMGAPTDEPAQEAEAEPRFVDIHLERLLGAARRADEVAAKLLTESDQASERASQAANAATGRWRAYFAQLGKSSPNARAFLTDKVAL